ncbi:MAG: outer membrane beta-barrel protein [Acidobacteriaceae bacterium]
MTIQFGGLSSFSRAFYRETWLVLVPALIFSVVLLFSSTPLNAQVANGINGTVTDATGAVVAGAKVTATNNSTAVVSHAVTSSAGTFVVVGLNPGHYSVAVEAPGFKRSVQTDVTVEVAKMSDIAFKMTPGSASSSVQVVASAISLNTTSPVIGTTLEPELVKTAPIEINGLVRQIDSFMYLAPGVQGSAGSHNIDGGVTFENEVQFNGVPVAFVDYAGNQTNINPPYEMVNEFRVNSSTFDSRYGLGQGAVTYNMASGTNQLHGDAFEILRNQLFDSDGFFPTHFSSDGHPAPPVDQQNDYGFTVSGPVILPRLYNGKDRTFFLFSSDWFKQNQAQNSIGTVPTAAMKQGDFSNFVNATGATIPIYDPQTGQPFPGNKIPANRFSALASSILPSVPNPDRAGINSGLQSNKTPAVSSVSITQHVWGYTIDHNLSSSQSIHFSQWRNSLSSPFFTSAPIVPSSDELQSEVNNTQLGSGFLLNYVKTVTPSLVMTAGADWIGLISGQHNADMGVKFGGVTGGITFPLVNFDGQNAPTSWGAAGGAFFECCSAGLTVINNRRLGIVLVNNWLWSKGRHTVNFGGQFRHTYQDIIACQFCSGTFNFSQRTTSTPNSNDPNFGSYGSSFASFLLGEADAGIRIFANEQKLRNKAFAFYIQDDIKVNNRLTVNAGLRWDILVPFTDDTNQIIYVNPTEPNPGAGGLPGAATKFGNCSGCSGITRADIHWKYFQPRLGFSYALNSKTVLQSGFYITMLDGGAYEYGTAQAASFMSTLLDGQFLRASTGSSVPGYGNWDANPLPLPQSTPFSPSIGNGGVIFAFDPKKVGTAPYDQAWNFSVQRQLPWNMFLTLAYVGNRAIHLPTTLELSNQPNPSVLKYGSLLGELVTSPDAVAAGIKVPYPGFVQQFGASATVEQALTPFPQFGGYFPVYEMDGTSFYNAFQVQAEKRFSNGLSYLADATLSRNMANTSIGSAPFSPNGLNAYNPRPEYVPSYLDQLYVTNFVATYELPVGRGQRYLNSKGLLGQVLGGWQISGIMTYSGGTPMGAYNNYNPLLVNGFDRPNIVPGVALKTFSYSRSKDYFTGKTATQPIQFTTNAFANTGPWAIGDSKRAYAALRTPPLRTENFDIIKYFHITDRVQASLRVDYFNAFNRTQLQAPDQNSLDSTFGQITNLSSQISNRQGQATFRLEF